MVHHVDPETLALLALGETDVASPDEHAHLRQCEPCQDELAALGDVTTVARSASADDALVPPGDHVWDAIRAEVGFGTVDAGTETRADADTRPDAPAPVAALDDHRRRRYSGGWIAAAASVALVVGVTGGVLWEGRDTTTTPQETTLASATLDALPEWDGASGDARLEESEDGRRQVTVSMDAPPSADGYHEVWLIADDLSGLVSLGVLEGTEGTFDVPEGLDVSQYSLVDVSEEHFDGDPTHSGDSIVRGGLEA